MGLDAPRIGAERSLVLVTAFLIGGCGRHAPAEGEAAKETVAGA